MEFLPYLPPELKVPAARLFVSSFHDEMRPLFGQAERALRLFTGNLDPRCCLVAVSEQKLAGLLAIQKQDAGFLHLAREAMVAEYGLIRGSIKLRIYRRFQHASEQDEWYVDGLAVVEEMRGQGIGTRLLDLFESTARAQGVTKLSLEVVDTNPRARALYERRGFVATKETSIRPINRLFRLPFSSVTEMEKTLPADAAP